MSVIQAFISEGRFKIIGVASATLGNDIADPDRPLLILVVDLNQGHLVFDRRRLNSFPTRNAAVFFLLAQNLRFRNASFCNFWLALAYFRVEA